MEKEILDLLIGNLLFNEGICEVLGQIIREALTLNEYEQMRDEFFIHFHQRDLDGLSYMKSDTTRSGFRKNKAGNYYFGSYKERIDFLTDLKTTNDIRTGN